MQHFMQDQNLTLFLRRLLAEQADMDEERRRVIFELLAEEEANREHPRLGQNVIRRLHQRWILYAHAGER